MQDHVDAFPQPQQQSQRTARGLCVRTVGAGLLFKFVDSVGGETTDAQILELPVGRHDTRLGVALPVIHAGEEPRVLLQAERPGRPAR